MFFLTFAMVLYLGVLASLWLSVLVSLLRSAA